MGRCIKINTGVSMKMTVAKKMGWMTLLAIIGIVSLLGSTQYEIEKVYQSTNYVNTNITPSIGLIGHLQLKFNTLRIRLANHVITDDPAKMQEIETAIRGLQQELNEAISQYPRYITDDEDRSMLTQDQAGLQAYYDKMEVILNASRANQKVSAKQLYIAIRATADIANTAITQHIQKKTKLGDQAALDAATIKQQSIYRSVGLGLLICMVVGCFAYFTTRKLVQQLGGEPDQAVAIANSIARGDLDTRIDINNKDPDSLMAAMHHMQQTLKSVIGEQIRVADANQQGDIDAHIDTTQFSGSYQTMANNINMMANNQAQVMRKVVVCIDQFSRGNFDAPLETFSGKRAFINVGIERLRNNVKTFIAEMQLMSEQHDIGNIDQKINTSQFEGAYLQMAEGVNQMVFEHLRANQQAIQVVQAFGQGDLDQPLARFAGQKAFVNEAIEQVRDNLKRLIVSMNEMSQRHDAGDIEARMQTDTFAGAYQQMAAGVNAMVQGHIDLNRKAIAVVQAFGEGQFNQPLEAFPGKKAFINQAIETVRTNLRALSQDATMLADAARQGEVTFRVDAQRHKGEFRTIIQGVNQTLDMIVEPIKAVKEASETIRTAINEIAAGNQNLSERTEQQANTLAQTSSNMADLAHTVAQNADNAKQANALAIRASDVAIRGGEVVNDVVVTMSAINQSAKKIEDIIAVIDGIAFQTNILALNAAVEAARAGEQGRGFAVVAGEVGNLAQRSSHAAREIKELIADSVQKTAEGSRLVENAGATMHEVVDSVKHVADIISEISSASSEQTKGIHGVNQAVNLMDEATQQNAALVEQAAAAAQSLVNQADQLSEVISQFKLQSTSNTMRGLRTGTTG